MPAFVHLSLIADYEVNSEHSKSRKIMQPTQHTICCGFLLQSTRHMLDRPFW